MTTRRKSCLPRGPLRVPCGGGVGAFRVKILAELPVVSMACSLPLAQIKEFTRLSSQTINPNCPIPTF